MQRTKISVRCYLFVLLATMMSAALAAPGIQSFNPDSLQRIIDSQNGKSFVLVLWSLDCEYCQASLKTLARKKRTNKDLHIVTLATDPLGDAQAAALLATRLRALGLTADAWAFGAASPEQLRFMIDPAWHGEMPRSYWFKAGGEHVAYSGVLTSAAVDRLLAGL